MCSLDRCQNVIEYSFEEFVADNVLLVTRESRQNFFVTKNFFKELDFKNRETVFYLIACNCILLRNMNFIYLFI